MRKLLGVLAVAALLIAGCGGDDNKSENASASSDTTSAAADNDSGGGGGNNGRFCETRAGFEALNQQATPDKNALRNAAANIEKAADNAPTEIKADVRTIATASKPFFELLASVDYDFTKLMSDESKAKEFQEIGAKMTEDNVEKAAERVNAWVEAHCK